jgi:MFS family permease
MADTRTAGSKMRSIVFASSVGTIIEWYDFLIYATAAALVFNKAFFPTIDPLAGTLAALGTYAVGFLARPLGGALFGHFGDRLGRKSMLVLTMFIMGLSTFCIGLLPNYASIGVFAPILLILLRIVQGIGLGGEWGGASLMVIEHSPVDKRGFYGSFVQIGFPIGLVLATLVFALATKLPEADFQAWGWRIPFLASIVLLALGTFIRSRIPETPVFERMRATDSFSKNPVGEAIGKNFKTFLIAVGLKLSEVSLGLHADRLHCRVRHDKAGAAQAIIARRRDVRGAVRTGFAAAVWLVVGQNRPASIVHPGCYLHDGLRIPSVLDAGDKERCHGDDRNHDCHEFRSWHDVRTGVDLFPRAVWPACPL